MGRTIPGSSEAIPSWPESAGRTRNFSSAYPHPPYPLVKNNCNHNRRYHLSCPILFECSVPWDTLRAKTLNSVCVLVAQSYPTLRNPWTVAHQAPLSMGFSSQEYWSGLLSPPPRDLSNPRAEPMSPESSAPARWILYLLNHLGSGHSIYPKYFTIYPFLCSTSHFCRFCIP